MMDGTVANDFVANETGATKGRREREVSTGAMYRSASAGPGRSASTSKLTVRHPVDKTVSSDFRVQDHSALSGTRQKLPTNLPVSHGTTAHNNVNIVRFQRKQSFLHPTTQLDGGQLYDPQTVVGNWVEDRRDQHYRSGTHPKELRDGRMYQTEQTDNFRPRSASYMNLVQTQYGAAKFPRAEVGERRVQSAATRTKSGAHGGTHINYVKAGFGRVEHQDHTSEGCRGAFWVGTAPYKPYDSIAKTSGRQEPLEFQARCSVQDPRSMLLLKTKPLMHTDASTIKTTERLAQSQRWTKNWQTSNKTDFVQHSLR